MKKILFLIIAIVVFPVMAEQSLYNQNYNSASRQQQSTAGYNNNRSSYDQSQGQTINNNSRLGQNNTRYRQFSASTANGKTTFYDGSGLPNGSASTVK